MKKINSLLSTLLLLGVLSCSSDSDNDPLPETVKPTTPEKSDTQNLKLPVAFKSGSGLNTSFKEIPPAGQNWEIVAILTDEFDQDKLDATKWDDYHPHWGGRAPSNFLKGNAFVDGSGVLKLRSTLKKDPNSVANKFKDIWVNAAACLSKEKTAKPGYYYEASMKASSLSMTSSFWFRVGAFSEIDVIEHIGNPSRASRQNDLPFEYHANTHTYTRDEFYKKNADGTFLMVNNNRVLKDEFRPRGASYKMKERGDATFHVYGFWWKSPTELIFYHDGIQVFKITPSTPFNENLKMVFDTEVFPFETAGVANIGLPLPENLNDNTKNTMQVDYVRVYKKSNATTHDAGLLKNGNFETQRLNNWRYNGNVSVSTKTTEESTNEGVISVKLEDKGSIGQPITLKANTDYTLTFYAKGKGAVQVLGQAEELTENADWKKITYTFTNEKAGATAFIIKAADNETLLVDDFKLVKN